MLRVFGGRGGGWWRGVLAVAHGEAAHEGKKRK